MSDQLKHIKPLTDEQRLECAESARAVVVRAVGSAPTRDMFARTNVSQYPTWFTRMIGVLLAVLFLAAGLPSFFRLFTAGRDYFLHGIQDSLQAALVGLSTFVLAETLIIASTLAARVYFTGRERLVFAAPIVMGLSMALVGNWYVTQPYDVFGWLETLVPPFAVLFIALIGERLILDAIETRHANERAYSQALADYHLATANPERHPRYTAAYANALRRKLMEVQGVGAGAKARLEILATLSTDDWRALVRREMQADEWYTNLEISIDTPTQREETPPVIPFGPTAHTPDGGELIPTTERATFSTNGHTARASVN